MHRSYWDLEVYARDVQERRRQEAARSQLGAEAAAGKAERAAGGNPLKLAFASILSAWNARLGSGRAAGLPESYGMRMNTGPARRRTLTPLPPLSLCAEERGATGDARAHPTLHPQSVSVAEPGLIAADVAGQRHRSARGRLSQPYADMIVIARGPRAGVTEQPSGVSDC